MGCGVSKLDDLEAVSLCRDRTSHLADAIRLRYVLADAHAAYADSLRGVAVSLSHLLLNASSLPAPVIMLPQQRKGDPPAAASATASAAVPVVSSPSGSHIQFHSSDSDDDDDEDISPFHTDDDDDEFGHHMLHDEDDDHGSPVVRLHYARNQPPPNSVSYEHHAPETGNIQFASASPPPPYSSYQYSDPYAFDYSAYYGGYPPNVPPSHPYGGYPPNVPPSQPYGGYPPNVPPPQPYGGYPPNVPPPQPSWATPGASSSQPKRPPSPPPPPPPVASTWDFLNPFEANESYYPPYTPSRSSNEVREAEGIPDLEDEDHEVVKEAYGDRKFAGSTSTSTSGSPEEHVKGKGKGSVGETSHYQTRSVPTVDDEDVVEKKVVGDEVKRPNENVAAAQANRRRFHDVSEIGGEIKNQGDRAFSTAMELSEVLEVGKHPYHHHKSVVYKVPILIMCAMPPSSSGEDFMTFEEDMERSSKNLSSTLQRLYIWEKKLQDEVRAEEKMRLLHDKYCTKLKRMDERGAEAHKLDEVQKLIRKLSTKIRIAIQVVNTISTKINKLRDEELWPRIKELIQGLVRMWKGMLECYRIQCEAISEAKNLDSIAYGGRLSETCLEAILQLELELLRWIGNFSTWINAQKSYVKAMNGWLVKCLHYEPEETADGVPPYSPGRIGAPPVFVICNYWSQALDRLSEKEVISIMQAFATNLRRVWEQQSIGQHQQMTANRDMDTLAKARERQAQIMHKEVDALNRRLVLVSGEHNNPPDPPSEASSLHLGLKQVFEAMESFTADTLKAYEELHMQSQEEEAAGG